MYGTRSRPRRGFEPSADPGRPGGRRPDAIVLMSVAIIALVLAGGIVTYNPGIYVYDAEAEWHEGGVDFEASSSAGSVYDALLLDNRGAVSVTELWIYLDDGYDRFFDEVAQLPGMVRQDQRYYVEQSVKTLALRGFTEVRVCDAAALAEVVQDLAGSAGVGILTYSYALPSEVYAGAPDDPILEWIHAGGTLYWVGSEIGGYYTDGSGLHRVADGQTLFLGRKCVNTAGVSAATGKTEADGLTDALCLYNANVLFGLDTSGLDDCLSLGFEESGYSSIALVRSADGMVVVVAGKPDYYRTDDLAQVIAAGLTYSTVLVDSTRDGIRGTASGSLASDGALTDPALYIFFGGHYLVRGVLFRA